MMKHDSRLLLLSIVVAGFTAMIVNPTVPGILAGNLAGGVLYFMYYRKKNGLPIFPF